MYIDYFGLHNRPFELTPDPDTLFLTETHKEGLAYLTYGIQSQKGFVLLTGEVGTGKTTLLYTLTRNIRNETLGLFIANPMMTPSEFRIYIARKLKLPNHLNKAEFLVLFERFLKQLLRVGKRFVLIVDEAQKITAELAEEIRLLSNIETAKGKLLTIVLVGQPELLELLSREEMRALYQRIALRYHIRPLSVDECFAYISHRMRVAGTPIEGIFPQETCTLIRRYTHGYPRRINILCDHALITTFSKDEKRVTQQTVEECAAELGYVSGIVEAGEERHQRSRRRFPRGPKAWAAAGSALMCLAILVWFVFLARNGFVAQALEALQTSYR